MTNLYYASVFIIALIIKSSLVFGMENLPQIPKVEELFRAGFLEDTSGLKAPELFRESFTAQDPAQKIKFVFESARYGFLPAIHAVGLSHLQLSQIYYAATWFSLANQISWLKTGLNYKPSHDKLEGLFKNSKLSATDARFIKNSYLNHNNFAQNNISIPCQVRLKAIFDLIFANSSSGLTDTKIIHGKFLLDTMNDLDSRFEGMLLLSSKADENAFEQIHALTRLSADIGKRTTDDESKGPIMTIVGHYANALMELGFQEQAVYSAKERELFEEIYHYLEMSIPYAEKALLDALLNRQALLLAKKAVFELADDERYAKAEALFEKSDTPEARENLAALYYKGHLGAKLKSTRTIIFIFQIINLSNSIKAIKNCICILIEIGNSENKVRLGEISENLQC